MSDERLEGGQVVGRWVLEEKLGTGGFGSVWRAREAGAEPVALKLLHEKNKQSAWVLDRFIREAQVLGGLDHPNIARLLAWSAEGEHPYLAMELVEGATLDEEIVERDEEGRAFRRGELLGLMRALAGALDHAHSRGIVHRDLKPRNVIVWPVEGGLDAKVLDFGIAKILGGESGDATTVGRMLGSLLYLSPEQIASAPVGPAADIFALGSILFELLTFHRAWARDQGDRPLPAGTPISRDGTNTHLAVLTRISKGPRPRPSDARPGISKAVDEVVLSALAIDPRARPATAAELLRALEAALEDDDALPPNEPTPVRTLTSPGPEPQGTATDARRPAPTSIVASARGLSEPVSARVTRPISPRDAVLLAVGAGAVLALGLLLAFGGEAPPEEIRPIEQPPAEVVVHTTARAEEPAPEPPPPPAPVEPPPEKKPRPAPPKPVMAAPPPPPAVAKRPFPALDALLARAKRESGNVQAVAELAEGIKQAAGAVADPEERTAIKRCATSATMTGELSQVEACLSRLVRAAEAQ